MRDLHRILNRFSKSCRRTNLSRVIEIRLGSAADADAIARVRRQSWFAAYEGIIATPVIDRATAPGATAMASRPYRRTMVAVDGACPAVVGYASFGPERTVA